MAAISAPPLATPRPHSAWRSAHVALEIAAWLLLLAGALGIAFSLAAPGLFGWQFVVVHDHTMQPAIPAGSLAVFGNVPPQGVYRGDVVLFHLPDGTRVTHRVTSLAADGMVVTKGDSSSSADPGPISVGALEGKLLFSVPLLGYVVSFAHQPAGFGVIVLVPGLLVLLLSLASLFRAQPARPARRRSTVNPASPIFRYPPLDGEDEIMRFPLRRHHELPEDPRPREPVPFVPPLARAAEPAPPPAQDEPPPAEHPHEPAPEPALRPAPPVQLNLRGQFTASDARAERLVRAVRGDLEELRDALDQMTHDRGEFLQADIEAILADPESAASLPAPVLVRALAVAHERSQALHAERDAARKRAASLKARLRDLRLEHAAVTGRMETLQEVIAALHANLEDLRSERNSQPLLAGPLAPAPQPIRAAAHEPLPAPRLVDRD